MWTSSKEEFRAFHHEHGTAYPYKDLRTTRSGYHFTMWIAHGPSGRYGLWRTGVGQHREVARQYVMRNLGVPIPPDLEGIITYLYNAWDYLRYGSQVYEALFMALDRAIRCGEELNGEERQAVVLSDITWILVWNELQNMYGERARYAEIKPLWVGFYEAMYENGNRNPEYLITCSLEYAIGYLELQSRSELHV